MHPDTVGRNSRDIHKSLKGHRSAGSLAEIATQLGSSIPKKQSLEWFVGKKAYVPRRVIMKSCQLLDEAGEQGLMREKVFQKMVYRFDRVFNHHIDSSAKVADVINHLKKHTTRRRGASVVSSGFIEWEHTSRIYELFSTDLNFFERIFFTIDVGESTAVLPKIISFFLISMIFISIVTWMVGTIPACQSIPDKDLSSGKVCNGNTEAGECAPTPLPFFKIVESVCVVTFTVEYLVRLFTVHSVRKAFQNERFLECVLTGRDLPMKSRATFAPQVASAWEAPVSNHPAKLDGKLKATFVHVTSFSNVIDLLAIAPFWLEVLEFMGGGGFLVVLRVLRLTRVFRIFKVGKYNDMFTLFSRVFSQSIEAIGLMIFFILLDCCLFGTLMWFSEMGTWYPEGNPALNNLGIVGRGAYLRHTGSKTEDDLEESPFQSIIHASWYVIVTITTVGYGDMWPKTPEGKLIGAFAILKGIIVLAMPVGVVGANFGKEYYDLVDEKKRRKRIQKQLAAQEEVEHVQDAVLLAEDDTESDPAIKDLLVGGAAIHIDRKREEILQKAESIDDWWREKLPQTTHRELSEELRFFVVGFIEADAIEGSIIVGDASGKPRVHLPQLLSLDVLTANVLRAISSLTSADEVAEFGLKEAFDSRKEWNRFLNLCWRYAESLGPDRVDKCCPALEYAKMEANIASRDLSNKSRSGIEDSTNTVKPECALDSAQLASLDGIREEGRSCSKASLSLPPSVEPPDLQVTGTEMKQAENGGPASLCKSFPPMDEPPKVEVTGNEKKQ